jgi:hypothetical protein
MNLNESHVEEAALEWFGELGYAVGHGPDLAPGEAAAERDSLGEVVLVGTNFWTRQRMTFLSSRGCRMCEPTPNASELLK